MFIYFLIFIVFMSIFKAYDIRGVYGKDFDEKQAYLIGYYIIKFLNLNEFKVAHDARLSKDILTKFFIKGVIDAGGKPIYLGEISTPNFYFSLFSGCNNGVVITASHNSKEYNGFKFMINLESFDSRNGLFDLEKLVLNDLDKKVLVFNKIKNKISNLNINDFLDNNNLKLVDYKDKYSDFLLGKFKNILTKNEIEILNRVKFGLDFSSGMSSIANKKLYKILGLNIKYYNDILDGTFPIHSPDPLKAQEFIKYLKDDLFCVAVFDGDGDRIVFYDGNKNLVFSDYTIAGYIDFFSNNNNNNYNNFVVDLRVSKIVKQIADKKNLNIDFIRVGRAFYKEYMDKNNCKFGAELSGHLFFDDFHGLDNPDIAFIYMLKLIANNLIENKNIKFENIFEKYKIYSKIAEKNLKVKNVKIVFEKLKLEFSDFIISEIDGISFDFSDWWFNIRKSNTEPVVRINLEAKNNKIAEEKMSFLEDLIFNLNK